LGKGVGIISYGWGKNRKESLRQKIRGFIGKARALPLVGKDGRLNGKRRWRTRTDGAGVAKQNDFCNLPIGKEGTPDLV